MGLSKLNQKCPLICFFDDDIVLEQDAFKNMINYWNQVDSDTAGICFNIVNEAPPPFSWFGKFIFFSSSMPGKVLASGRSTSLANIKENIRSEWLGGGYTIWKHDILKKYAQENLNTNWAIGEDLKFSYPIGKKYPLFVCADAKVRHEHIYDQYPKKSIYKIRGFKETVFIIHFVQINPNLSKLACLWMLSTSMILRLCFGLITMKYRYIGYAIGQSKGIFNWLLSGLGFRELKSSLEDW